MYIITHSHTHIHMHMNIITCSHTYTNTNAHNHTHTYTQMHIITYTHIHIIAHAHSILLKRGHCHLLTSCAKIIVSIDSLVFWWKVSIFLSVFLSVFLSFYLSIFLFVFLSVLVGKLLNFTSNVSCTKIFSSLSFRLKMFPCVLLYWTSPTLHNVPYGIRIHSVKDSIKFEKHETQIFLSAQNKKKKIVKIL